MKKFFLFFTIIVMIFAAASTLLAAEAIDCPRALGNLCEDPSVEKLTDEETRMPRGPMKAPAREKMNILDIAGKRGVKFSPR